MIPETAMNPFILAPMLALIWSVMIFSRCLQRSLFSCDIKVAGTSILSVVSWNVKMTAVRIIWIERRRVARSSLLESSKQCGQHE
jgi:hypothetical protein